MKGHVAEPIKNSVEIEGFTGEGLWARPSCTNWKKKVFHGIWFLRKHPQLYSAVPGRKALIGIPVLAGQIF